jgi:hypothetical protein
MEQIGTHTHMKEKNFVNLYIYIQPTTQEPTRKKTKREVEKKDSQAERQTDTHPPTYPPSHPKPGARIKTEKEQHTPRQLKKKLQQAEKTGTDRKMKKERRRDTNKNCGKLDHRHIAHCFILGLLLFLFSRGRQQVMERRKGGSKQQHAQRSTYTSKGYLMPAHVFLHSHQ